MTINIILYSRVPKAFNSLYIKFTTWQVTVSDTDDRYSAYGEIINDKIYNDSKVFTFR